MLVLALLLFVPALLLWFLPKYAQHTNTVTTPSLSQPNGGGSASRRCSGVSYKYHGFATHTWAKDMLGRDTHARVIHVCNELRKRGIDMWLDQERMEGNIVDQMTQGIDDSCTFVVFLTRAYVEKVKQTENANDNCKMEFQYGMYRRDHDSNRVLVMMEEDVKRKGSLKGPVGLHLGHLLYHDLSQDDVPSHDAIEKLSHDIKQKCRGFDIVSASAGAGPHVSSSATARIPPQRTTHTLRDAENVFKGTIISGSAVRGVGQFECVEGPLEGATYTGPFEGDVIAGSGAKVYVNGDKYEGVTINGVKNGKGTYYWASGNKYEGQWRDDNMSGKGTYYWANGNKYEGEWKDNRRNGYGIYYLANGDKYEGEWKDGKQDGKGTYYFASGDKFEGEYKENNKVNGRVTRCDGSLVSEYKNGSKLQV